MGKQTAEEIKQNLQQRTMNPAPKSLLPVYGTLGIVLVACMIGFLRAGSVSRICQIACLVSGGLLFLWALVGYALADIYDIGA